MCKHRFSLVVGPFHNTLSVKKDVISGIEHTIISFFHPHGYFGQIVRFRFCEILIEQGTAVAENPNIGRGNSHGVEGFVSEFIDSGLFYFYLYKFT